MLFNKTNSIGYDGNSEIFVNPKQYDVILNFKSKYFMVPKNKGKSMIDDYANYIKIATELKSNQMELLIYIKLAQSRNLLLNYWMIQPNILLRK